MPQVSVFSKGNIFDFYGQPAFPANPPIGQARMFYDSGNDTFHVIDSSGADLLGAGGGAVSSVFGRTGAVVAQTGDFTQSQISAGAIANGTTATTQTALSNDTKVATDAYVDTAIAVAGLGTVSKVTVTLTAAQINAMSVTPITLVAAPGSGNYIFPIAVLMEYVFGAIFIGGNNLLVGVGAAGVTQIWYDQTSTGFIDQTSSRVAAPVPADNVASLAGVSNAALVMTATGAFTGGTGSTLKVTVFYNTITA